MQFLGDIFTIGRGNVASCPSAASRSDGHDDDAAIPTVDDGDGAAILTVDDDDAVSRDVFYRPAAVTESAYQKEETAGIPMTSKPRIATASVDNAMTSSVDNVATSSANGRSEAEAISSENGRSEDGATSNDGRSASRIRTSSDDTLISANATLNV